MVSSHAICQLRVLYVGMFRLREFPGCDCSKPSTFYSATGLPLRLEQWMFAPGAISARGAEAAEYIDIGRLCMCIAIGGGWRRETPIIAA